MPRFVLNETSYHGAGAIDNIVPEVLRPYMGGLEAIKPKK